jgi:hypothetical protein
MINSVTKTVFGSKLKKSMLFADALKFLASHRLLNEGELTEIAISKKTGIKKCKPGTPQIDLVNGVQIKHARSHPKSNGRGQLAFITIGNTRAPIFAVITESVTGEQYFLHIPYSARKKLKGSCISITFDNDGKPGYSRWLANHRVDSFNELCKLAKNA